MAPETERDDIEIEPIRGMTLWAALDEWARKHEPGNARAVIMIGHGQGDSSTITTADARRFAAAIVRIADKADAEAASKA